uniref:Riboflavin biosynthesis protein n=1 Tax=Desulfatirhabdium butyrativorans TaxID=340467 RepID=A0A7C4VZI2_9BACT
MRVHNKLTKISSPFPNAVVTIGNFDGVHLGHQALFHEVIEKADAIGGTSVAITFEPHPIRVLKGNGDPPLLTRFEQKVELIARSGITELVCIPFTPEFASLSAESFVTDILLRTIGMKAIVTGKDYTFGKNRSGTIDLLKSLAMQHGFEVIVSDWILHSGEERISSTKIREYILAGEMDAARKMLGRHYQISGTVVSGRNRGARLLGFPTANIALHDEVCPKTGVYAVTVECLEKVFWGVANIGYSPTFDDNVFTIEIHILDFHNDIYGKNIRVNVVERIRDEQKFASLNELTDQIRKDIQVARNILIAWASPDASL